MTQSADTDTSTEPRRPGITLDYGQQPTLWMRCRAEVQERIDGVLAFIGIIIYMLGGWRQLSLAIGLSCLVFGIGCYFDPFTLTHGPQWTAIGAFFVGLVLPIKKRKE